MIREFSARLGGENKQSTVRAIAEPSTLAPYTARVRFEVKRNDEWIRTSLSAFNPSDETIPLNTTLYFETMDEAEKRIIQIANEAI